MLKKCISNLLLRLIINADSKYKILFHNSIKSNSYSEVISLFRQNYSISKEFKFNGKEINLYGEGQIILGCNSYIGNYSTIQSDLNCVVEIGNNCAISHNVRIYTSTYVSDQDFNLKNKEIKKGNVIIGNGVWVGANVFINPGIKIGENSIIGSNSVVTKDVLPNSINGGVPCRLIKLKHI